MPVPDRTRARHMSLRLARHAARVGIKDGDLLAAAFQLAMAPRHCRLDDDHDPRYLHPGRTALVAMDDAGVRDPVLLAAAILAETEEPCLACDLGAVAETGDARLQEALEVARGLPSPGCPDLTEKLVTAEEGVRLVALSERLDQLRHLRLWAEEARVREAGEEVVRVYLPMAERTHPVLARRFRWWVRRVGPGLSAS